MHDKVYVVCVWVYIGNACGTSCELKADCDELCSWRCNAELHATNECVPGNLDDGMATPAAMMSKRELIPVVCCCNISLQSRRSVVTSFVYNAHAYIGTHSYICMYVFGEQGPAMHRHITHRGVSLRTYFFKIRNF